MSENLASMLAAAPARGPGRTALFEAGSTITYGELDTRSARMAGLLRDAGAGPGDRVALLLPNGAAFVAAYHGALRLGAQVVPLNVLLRSGEIGERLAAVGTRLVVTTPDRARELDADALDPSDADAAAPVTEIADVAGDDVAVLLFTSGTAGHARAAQLSHAVRHVQDERRATSVLGLRPDDVLLGAVPMTHVFGQSGVMNAAFAGGAAIAVMERFRASEALELMAGTKTSVLLGVPTMCIALLAAAEERDAPALRIAHTGGAPMPPDTLRAFESVFRCPVLEGYGMTETAGAVVSHQHGMRRKPGSVGLPVPGAEVRISAAEREVGEIVVRSPTMMRGYLGEPDPLAAGGWLATGDLGRLDGDGYLFLVDRKKDVILRGGYTVYPRQVEDVLAGHPDVREVAVVGVPDPLMGEEVAALVVLRPGAACDAALLREFARERLAAYAYPRLVSVVDGLPTSATGKVLKREIDREALRSRLAEQRGDRA